MTCSFCDEGLQQSSLKHIPCCNKQAMMNNEGIHICQSCSTIDSYRANNEFIDFYDNLYNAFNSHIWDSDRFGLIWLKLNIAFMYHDWLDYSTEICTFFLILHHLIEHHTTVVINMISETKSHCMMFIELKYESFVWIVTRTRNIVSPHICTIAI